METNIEVYASMCAYVFFTIVYFSGAIMETAVSR